MGIIYNIIKALITTEVIAQAIATHPGCMGEQQALLATSLSTRREICSPPENPNRYPPPIEVGDIFWPCYI